MAGTPTTPQRFKWLKRLGILALLLAVLVYFLPTIASLTLKDHLIANSTKDITGKLTVGELSLGWFSEPELRNVTLTDTDGKTVATAERVTVKKSLISLFSNHSHLGTIEVHKPELWLESKNKSSNVEEVLQKYLVSQSSPQETRGGMNIEISEGQIHIVGRGKSNTFGRVTAGVTIPVNNSEDIKVQFDIQSTDSTQKLQLQGLVGANKDDYQATLVSFPAEIIGPLIERYEPNLNLSGLLTGSMKVTIKNDSLESTSTLTTDRLAINSPRVGPDQLVLNNISTDLAWMLSGDTLTVRDTLAEKNKSSAFECDLGRVEFQGTINLTGELTEQAGLSAKADIDLTKLATRLPKLVKLKTGTQLSGGRLTAMLTSTNTPTGILWNGTVTTTDIRGNRDGRTLAWDQPLKAHFALRLGKDGMPTFDVLEAQSDFVALAARGTADNFVAAANVDLNRLAARLADFIDMDGLKLEGTGRLDIRNTPAPNGGFRLDGKAILNRVTIYDRQGRGLQEPDLTLNIQGIGSRNDKGLIKIDSGTVGLVAGGDNAEITLTEPIQDLVKVRTGAARLALAGDLTRWRNRLTPFVAIPESWQTAGQGKLTAKLNVSSNSYSLTNATLDIGNAKLRLAGIALDDPRITLQTDATIDRKTSDITLGQTVLVSETLNAKADSVVIRFAADGTPDIRAAGTIGGSLAKVQSALSLASDPTGADMVNGQASGQFRVTTTAGRVNFDSDFIINNVIVGPVSKPTWKEPRVNLNVQGEWDAPSDALQLRSAKAELDGLTINAKGMITHLASTQDITFDGNLTYDLAKLEPKIKAYLGAKTETQGKDTKPFTLRGRLSDAGNLAVNVGTSTLNRFQGNAAVGWQKIKAYGFDVGPSEMRADLNAGMVRFDPIKATFGDGRVQLEPTLSLKDYILTIKPGRAIDRAKLTPAACSDAIGFAIPVIAKSTQSEGLVSMELVDAIIPLMDTNKADVKARLTLHKVKVSPGPVAMQFAELLGATNVTLTLADENVVTVVVAKGRVHHAGLELDLRGYKIKTNGSVGFDGTLDMQAELPMNTRLLDGLLKDRPLIRDALAKKTIMVRMTGTLDNPRVDAQAFKASTEKLVKDAMADTAKGALEGLFKPKK